MPLLIPRIPFYLHEIFWFVRTNGISLETVLNERKSKKRLCGATVKSQARYLSGTTVTFWEKKEGICGWMRQAFQRKTTWLLTITKKFISTNKQRRLLCTEYAGFTGYCTLNEILNVVRVSYLHCGCLFGVKIKTDRWIQVYTANIWVYWVKQMKKMGKILVHIDEILYL